MKCPALEMVLQTFIGCLIAAVMAGGSSAQPARGARAVAPNPPGIIEVIPTARQTSVEWRYTIEQPADGWKSPAFNDEAWKTGNAPFGTENTPGINVKTTWKTDDIWLRRVVTLPEKGVDFSTLQLLVFHDDDVEVYFDGVRAAQESGFTREYQPLVILPTARKFLKPGSKFVIAVHCHQINGGQGIDVGLAQVPVNAFSDAAIAKRKDNYRGFAVSHPGDPINGRKLFLDEQRLACSRCHSTDGKGEHAGPDLFTAGDKFPRAELIDAILNPSATIAIGYSTTVVTTQSHEVVVGVLKEATDQHLGLMGVDGKMQRVPLSDVLARRNTLESIMPEGLEAGVSPQEFTDLIEYLVSLRLPKIADAGRQGMPSEIPEIRTPVGVVPFHTEELRFNHPCWFGQIPGEPSQFLVCEHETGRVWRLSKSASGDTKTLWGDFGKEIHKAGATGLLGLTFHPKFRENHIYYVQHEMFEGAQLYAYVSEKIASPDFRADSGKPSRTVIKIACATVDHAGGGIEFGPEGYLYVAMGDTGPQGDPQGHGQDLHLPLGKMLRIDVDHDSDGLHYAIPADNPFRTTAGARPEIWAYGLREPWRFSFDPLNGDLWVGDVGQDRIEEVDIIRPGENYGWNVYEGFDLYSNKHRSEGAAYVSPVFAYNRRFGNSITGGYVYRGSTGAAFNGLYVCGDYNSKRIWGLKQSARKLTAIWQLCIAPERVTSFGRDEAGSLYVVGYEGTIYKLDFAAAELEAK